MLEHGGKLRAVVAQYGIPLDEWLDLSTGINPNGWRGAMPPLSSWSRLPEDEDGLHEAACRYYAAADLLPVAGSQAAIQVLPIIRAPSRVAVLAPSYNEHAYAWQRAGHAVDFVTADKLHTVIDDHDVLVVVNPNNPTGERFPVEQLLAWYEQLAKRGGWLIVDEAFIDTTPKHSLVPYSSRPGLIVLRSLGKFFGLAGARVGFVCAEHALLIKLNDALGPWAVSSPARWVATEAFKDRAWQQSTRNHLIKQSARLHTMLTRYELVPDGCCELFQWVRTTQAAHLHARLAQQGILTRLFTTPASLRFGLPGSALDWERLSGALYNLGALNPVDF